jgi:predicted ferric reductase
MSTSTLDTRAHIQNLTAAKTLEPHWGYADRAVPCTNDAGSCAYLDVVYSAHDRGMLYTGILWSTFGAILFIWVILRHFNEPTTSPSLVVPRSVGFRKLRVSLAVFSRTYLLPDAVRMLFGRTTRLQVLVLTALAGYLLIFSFVGITYNTWITPVSGMDGVYNTRSSIGPWSDRIGVLAYALTPLSVMLSSRESFLSLITGLPYQTFNFLHRWLGYIIFVQSSLHTIGWCIVELRLYQPQPSMGAEWVTQIYMVWGIVAMILLLLIFLLSTPWGIRLTGYETFRKLHYVLAMLYIGACWGHWAQLKCFLLPSLIFWFMDRGARFIRTAILHYHPSEEWGMLGFKSIEAAITRFPDEEHGDVIRLDMKNVQEAWNIGQHYYLCFPQGSVWQSHPFTPLNAPEIIKGQVKHSYILRAKRGETRKVADLASNGTSTTPVILTGAYGESITKELAPNTNIICIAGGTGITYVLPVLLSLAQQPSSSDRTIDLVWAIKHTSNVQWVRQELDILRKARKAMNLKIRIFVTREASSPTTSKESVIPGNNSDEKAMQASQQPPSAVDLCDCDFDVPVKLGGGLTDSSRHPDLQKLINEFLNNIIAGPTTIFASGPGGMLSDLRDIVASCNSASKVWKGQEKFDVRLVYDDRLEW